MTANPRTPTRKKCIESPYFSPTKRSSNVRREFSPEPDSNDFKSRGEDKVESEPLDTKELKDPLLCFYSRAFSQVYHQLGLVKPVLIQETLAHDPWKLLVAVTLLNKTSGKLAIPAFWNIISHWPDAWALSQANEPDLVEIIRPLGTYNIRARRLITLSTLYLQSPPSTCDPRPSRATIPSSQLGNETDETQDSRSSPRRTRDKYPPTPISHLPGAGPYALDSYRIFCTVHEDPFSDEWKVVMPTDKELIKYLRWKWAFAEHQEWIPGVGVARSASLQYLKNLLADLKPGPS